MRQWYALFLILFNRVLEFLARAVMQEKEMRGPNIEGKCQIIPMCRWYDSNASMKNS
jgi:hypothetical protein